MGGDGAVVTGVRECEGGWETLRKKAVGKTQCEKKQREKRKKKNKEKPKRCVVCFVSLPEDRPRP